MEIEPMQQFMVVPLASGERLALIWLEASLTVVQWAAWALVLMAIPLWRMLPRVGLSKWWALLAAFPPAAIVLVWIVGFRRWT